LCAGFSGTLFAIQFVQNASDAEVIIMDTRLIIALIVVALIVIGLGAWFFARRKKTERLRERFGPEYDKVVRTLQSQERAEAELSQREKRVRKFNIVSLPQVERARYQKNWLVIQSRFVDQPESAVAEANQLVQEVIPRCGYPLTDFEQSAADISVDHPRVVDNFRAANRIAERSERAAATTEELRQALVHYRILFEDLLESEEPGQSEPSETTWRRKGRTSNTHPNY
jgi:hypothetical protein